MTTPEIHILNVLIQEPTTLATDLVLGLAGFRFAWMVRDDSGDDSPRTWWTWFFIFIGFSTVFGGLAHGFGYAVGGLGRSVSWLSSGFAVLCAQKASIRILDSSRLRNVLNGVAWLQLLVFVGALVAFRSFLVVTVNTAVGLLGMVAAIHLWRYRVSGDRGSLHVVAAVLVAGVTALIHLFKLSPGVWFNHNDLSHVILIFSLYLFMLGARAPGPAASQGLEVEA